MVLHAARRYRYDRGFGCIFKRYLELARVLARYIKRLIASGFKFELRPPLLIAASTGDFASPESSSNVWEHVHVTRRTLSLDDGCTASADVSTLFID